MNQLDGPTRATSTKGLGSDAKLVGLYFRSSLGSCRRFLSYLT